MIKSKLKKMLADLRGFEFVTTLAVSIKKQRMMLKESIALFIETEMLK